MEGHEVMVNRIFPSQSKVQTVKNYLRSIDACADFAIFTPSRERQNGGETERTWYLMWKTDD